MAISQQRFSTFLIYAVSCLAGCGTGEEVPQAAPASKAAPDNKEEIITSDEAANQLFDETLKLIARGEAAGQEFVTAKHYEKALENIRKIVKKHPESAIARQVISNEKLFLGKSLTQFEDHVKGVREATRDVEVTLPTNPSATTLSSRSKIIVINVNRDGSYVVRARAMKLDQIEILLKKAVQKDPDQKVLVRGDGDALNRYANDVVITTRAAGVRESHLAVKQQPQ